MKKLIFKKKFLSGVSTVIISFLISGMIFTACDTKDVEPTKMLSVSENAIDFPFYGGENSFFIESNTNWSVELDASSWLTVTPNSGADNDTVVVTAVANTGTTLRTATIIVSSTGLPNHTISVTQSELDPLSVSLHVATAGTLSLLITENWMNEITDLKLTGYLNGDDIRFVRYMAGRIDFDNTTAGKLTNLDLSGVNIVKGGMYINGYTTSDNAITDLMFYKCANLKSFILPNSVRWIGQIAFYECTGLTSMTFGNNVSSIGDGAFYGCSSLTSVSFGNNLTAIGNGAFLGCTSLSIITFPSSVTSIGYQAFHDCTELATIHCENPTPPQIDAYTFDASTSISCKLYVPTGSSASYREQWGFDNIIEE